MLSFGDNAAAETKAAKSPITLADREAYRIVTDAPPCLDRRSAGWREGLPDAERGVRGGFENMRGLISIEQHAVGLNSLEHTFFEAGIHAMLLDGNLEERKRLDPTGFCSKVERGEKNFTGIYSPYETPEDSDITTRTDRESVEEAAEHLIEMLDASGVLRRFSNPRRLLARVSIFRDASAFVSPEAVVDADALEIAPEAMVTPRDGQVKLAWTWILLQVNRL